MENKGEEIRKTVDIILKRILVIADLSKAIPKCQTLF